ncbi:MAG: bifunctional oligoribonuclease/PAP phosphatase NrnA [Ruminococcus sp.]|nr:bifunctional oligoribonuclease/PAP phosphatase NrnA [Ruminococcus sp.]
MKYLSVQETAAHLTACESAEILIHRSPDGDCIGSGYALLYALRQMGKKARVVCHDPIPERYHFMLPEVQTLELFHPELIVAVDVADEKLLGDGLLEQYTGKIDLCIDHHISNTEYAEALCLDGQAAAAAQVLYAVLKEMPVTITKEIAACLYTGLATDTGCFMYDNVSPRTLRIAAEIMEQHPDIPYAQINRNMFIVKSMGRIRLDQLLAGQLESALDGQCMLICVTRSLMEEYGLDESELEGIAGFPLQVEGVQVGIVMKEREKGVFKVSMRSADWVNVSAICQTLGGGGHIKAAGCTINGSAEEAKRILIDAVAKGMAKA